LGSQQEAHTSTSLKLQTCTDGLLLKLLPARNNEAADLEQLAAHSFETAAAHAAWVVHARCMPVSMHDGTK
jgi:hypothetical protein